MKDLAPHITRQRLLIEATYQRQSVSRQDVIDYLTQLPEALGLRIYSEPVVFSPGGEGREENQGYDGFVALIDSGIAIYVWENAKFLSTVIYTCKQFDVQQAEAFTRRFFDVVSLEKQSF
ncbi:MAG: S-adenosylmethionine decarboxylase [Candidatus Melainabacteria bacterium]|nr:S-adenosylmethionine decarboxylase [Candidatus Melainabacteria bacterium]